MIDNDSITPTFIPTYNPTFTPTLNTLNPTYYPSTDPTFIYTENILLKYIHEIYSILFLPLLFQQITLQLIQQIIQINLQILTQPTPNHTYDPTTDTDTQSNQKLKKEFIILALRLNPTTGILYGNILNKNNKKMCKKKLNL